MVLRTSTPEHARAFTTLHEHANPSLPTNPSLPEVSSNYLLLLLVNDNAHDFRDMVGRTALPLSPRHIARTNAARRGPAAATARRRPRLNQTLQASAGSRTPRPLAAERWPARRRRRHSGRSRTPLAEAVALRQLVLQHSGSHRPFAEAFAFDGSCCSIRASIDPSLRPLHFDGLCCSIRRLIEARKGGAATDHTGSCPG